MLYLAIPPQVTGIPVFYALSNVNLPDSSTTLMLPSVGSALGIFLFRQFVLCLPQSLSDSCSARRDRPRSRGTADSGRSTDRAR